jgi:hypothetical protein
LGYAPTQRIAQGLELAMPWYIRQKSAALWPLAAPSMRRQLSKL